MMCTMPNPGSMTVLSAGWLIHAFSGGARSRLTLSGSIGNRNGAGGNAPERVAEQPAALTRRVRTLTEAW